MNSCRRVLWGLGIVLALAGVLMAIGASAVSAAKPRCRRSQLKRGRHKVRQGAHRPVARSPKAEKILVLNPSTSARAPSSVPSRRRSRSGCGAGRSERSSGGEPARGPSASSSTRRQDPQRRDLQLLPPLDLRFLDLPTRPRTTEEPISPTGHERHGHDARNVVKAATSGKTVVMGGHWLGGSITTAYATWDFNGKPGARGSPASSSSTAPARTARARGRADRRGGASQRRRARGAGVLAVHHARASRSIDRRRLRRDRLDGRDRGPGRALGLRRLRRWRPRT